MELTKAPIQALMYGMLLIMIIIVVMYAIVPKLLEFGSRQHDPRNVMKWFKLTTDKLKKQKEKKEKKMTKLPLLIHLLFYLFYDFKNYFVETFIKKNRKLHLFGIYGYLGLPSAGKTVSLTQRLLEYREKYGNDIYIFTNYGFKYEDKPFTNWKMLLEEYDKPCVFAWDEVQNEFNSRNFKNFPTDLLTILTQNRKGNGKQILWTAQRWGRVDKVFRELSFAVAECKTRFNGRLTSARFYDWEDYEQLVNSTNLHEKMRVKSQRRKIFVQTDYIRDSYDSYQMLETAKSKQYMSRVEIKALTEGAQQ